MRPHERRLSLTLLGLLLPGMATATEPPAGDATIPELAEPLAAATALSQDAGWQELLALWAEAAAIGAGERGAFPFDQAGKQDLLAKLGASAEAVDALMGRGLLSASEAGLLKADVDTLTVAVGKKRPSESQMATCYKPMLLSPARDSAQRLEARLPLLERLATEQTLHPEVIERVLGQIEADIATATTGGGYGMTPEDQTAAAATAARAQQQVAAIRARLETSR